MRISHLSDSALPGLATVVDEALFLPALASAITARDVSADVPTSMRIVRLRYRPEQRAIVNVEFGYQQADKQTVPASVWLYAGSKSKKRAAEGRDCRPLYEPRTDSLIYFYPADPYVPEIAALTSCPEIYAQSLSFAGFDRLAVSRFRPGIGATFLCANGERELAYIKIQKHHSPKQSVETLQKLQRAAKGKSFAVPEVAGLDERISAFSMRAAQGTSFDKIVVNGTMEELGSSTQQILQALADLHKIELTSERKLDRDQLILQSWDSAKSIANLEPACGAAAQHLATLLERLPVKLVVKPCHGDMKSEHAIVSETNVTLLDLDSFVLGDPLYDFAMLDLRVALLVEAGEIAIERAQLVSSLVAVAVADSCGPEAWHRFHWLRACAALQVGKHHVQKFEQASSRLVPIALQLGFQSINQIVELSSTAVHFPNLAEMEKIPCA